MGKKKRYKSCNFNKFSNFTIPPCAEFLGSNNPFVKDGKFIYKNLNRVYFLFLLFLYLSNSLINSFIKSSFENFSLTSFIAVISFSSIFS